MRFFTRPPDLDKAVQNATRKYIRTVRFRRTIPGGCALAQFHPKTHDDRR